MSLRPYYEQDGIAIFNGDCRELLPVLDGGFDCVMTDPPYASAAATATTGWAKQKWGGNWGDMSLVSFMAEAILDSPKLIAGAHEVFWFADHLGYAALVPSFFRRYSLVQNIVWDRDVLGMGAYFRKQTEFVIYARATNVGEFASTSARDIIRLRPTVADKQHPAQKPVELITRLLEPTSAKRILDPFMGSGTTLLAAKRIGRCAVGIEIEERYCEIAAKRLAQGALFSAGGAA